MTTGEGTSQQKRIRYLIVAVAAALTVAFSYGSGMRSQTKKLSAQGETLREVRQDLRVAQLGLQARDALLQQWEARRQVDRALRALDERNFGIARQNLDTAAARIATAEQVGAANTASLARFGNRLRELNVEASPNVETPRLQLLEIARQMDEALDKVAPRADDVAPLTVKAPTLNDVPRPPGPEIGR